MTGKQRHDLQVPARTWERYSELGLGPTEMREDLAFAIATRKARAQVPAQQDAKPVVGTRIIAKYRTRCPSCQYSIEPGVEAVRMDWDRGEAATVHLRCADHRGAAVA